MQRDLSSSHTFPTQLLLCFSRFLDLQIRLSQNQSNVFFVNTTLNQTGRCVLCSFDFILYGTILSLNILWIAIAVFVPLFQNVRLLSQFVSPYTGQLYDREKTGLCIYMQSRVAEQVKKAQKIGKTHYFTLCLIQSYCVCVFTGNVYRVHL